MQKSINLEIIRYRYARCKRKGKTKLLNELCDLYGYNRKYLLQFFNHLTGKKYEKRGRKIKYTADDDLLEPLKRIWLASDQLCSKRLKEAIPIWLPFYEETYEAVSDEIRQQLLSVSTGTLDRLLKPSRISNSRRTEFNLNFCA